MASSSIDTAKLTMSSNFNVALLETSVAFAIGQATDFEVGYAAAFGRRPTITVSKEEPQESIFDYCDEDVKVKQDEDWDMEICPNDSDWESDDEARPLFRCELRQLAEDQKVAKRQQALEDRDGTFQVGLVANRKERREILAMIGRHRVLPYPYVTVFFFVFFYFILVFSAIQGLQPAASASWRRSRSGSRM